MRRLLRQGGARIALRLAFDSVAEIAPNTLISAKFGIARSTLNRWRRQGRVIGFKPDRGRRYMFPIAQFSFTRVAPWAEKIVAKVGNGLPAFHFFMVPRESLEGMSLSRYILLRKGNAIQELESQLAMLDSEYP